MDFIVDCLPMDFPLLPYPRQEQIIEMDKVVFGAGHSWGMENFAFALADKAAFSFFAQHQTDLVGYAVAYRHTSLGEPWVHLSRLASHPSFRGRGIGKHLMEALFSAAQSKNIQKITVEVDEHQAKSVVFYLNLGFKALGLENGLLAYLESKGKQNRIQRYLSGAQRAFIKELK